ncbi:hypothetical protein H4R19_005232 [Coemansia spiralis]|nr:hypothetical protein H4R19_005232 [Coemansia spiralis]
MSVATPAVQQFAMELLDELEAERAQLKQEGRLTSEAEAAQHCTVFALRVFAKADTEDREGRATTATARNFVVSAQFLQVVAAYGELPPDVAEKTKYAKWRATEILKGVRNGQAPAPPPVAETAAETPPAPAVSAGDIMGWPSPPMQQTPPPQQPAPGSAASPAWSATSYPDMSAPQQPQPPLQQPTPNYPFPQPGATDAQPGGLPSVPRNRLPVDTAPTNARPAQPTPPSAATFIPMPAANLPPVSPQPADGAEGLMLDPTDAKAAQKFARWAISALEYDDVATAVDNLQKAIGVLARYQQH